jgi:hypothetical protein
MYTCPYFSDVIHTNWYYNILVRYIIILPWRDNTEATCNCAKEVTLKMHKIRNIISNTCNILQFKNTVAYISSKLVDNHDLIKIYVLNKFSKIYLKHSNSFFTLASCDRHKIQILIIYRHQSTHFVQFIKILPLNFSIIWLNLLFSPHDLICENGT